MQGVRLLFTREIWNACQFVQSSRQNCICRPSSVIIRARSPRAWCAQQKRGLGVPGEPIRAEVHMETDAAGGNSLKNVDKPFVRLLRRTLLGCRPESDQMEGKEIPSITFTKPERQWSEHSWSTSQFLWAKCGRFRLQKETYGLVWSSGDSGCRKRPMVGGCSASSEYKSLSTSNLETWGIIGMMYAVQGPEVVR